MTSPMTQEEREGLRKKVARAIERAVDDWRCHDVFDGDGCELPLVDFLALDNEKDIAQANERAASLVDFVQGEVLALLPTPNVAELIEALRRLITSAKLLYANAEGCAVNHHGEDFDLHGLPGWLGDAANDIQAAAVALSRAKGQEAGSLEALLCEDCPPAGYPTDKTRCDPCPRRALTQSHGDGQ